MDTHASPTRTAMNPDATAAPLTAPTTDAGGLTLLDLVTPLAQRWRTLLVLPVAAGAIAYGASFLMTPVYSATTVFMPPQQSQSGAASALASLGSLAGLAGGARTSPAEQYIAFMQSANVTDRLIDRFDLQQVYKRPFRDLTRVALLKHAQMGIGKKDGLITVEVEDTDPKRGAALANAFVEELRRMTSTLAVTEAQQRRVFFEHLLEGTRDKLAAAQTALQDSPISRGALKSDPRSAADGYARLRAELTAAEVKLQSMRGIFAEGSVELRQQTGLVQALHEQIGRLEKPEAIAAGGGDYVSRYREYKYQETLFDLLSRQYEAARVDEAREGALIQVVDMARPAERKSRPVRARVAITSAFLVTGLWALWVVISAQLRAARRDPATHARLQRLAQAFRRPE